MYCSRRLSVCRSPPRSLAAGILDLHIPKTGGASLVQKLWTPISLSSDHECVLKTHKNYENRVKWINGEACNWTAPAVMTGHTSLDIVRASAIMKTPRVYSITFLRDPLSRVVSYANFINLPLDKFLNGTWPQIAINLATMMLNGVRDVGPILSTSFLTSPVRGMCQYDPQDAVSTALENLVEVITVFGITEHYIESMWLFGKTFGWDRDTVKKPLFSTKKAFCSDSVDSAECGMNRFRLEDIDQDTRAAIRDHEYCDNAIYEAAVQVFEARLSAGDQDDLADFHSTIMMGES